MSKDNEPASTGPIEFAVGVGSTQAGRDAALTLSMRDASEAVADLAGALLMPLSEGRVSKLAGVAAGLDRAAARIRANMQPAISATTTS